MKDLIFEDFLDELAECGWRPTNDPGNKKIRAFWQSRQPDGYDASCIKVLPRESVEDKFPWERVQALAHEYKRDPTWIANGIEACRRSSVPAGHFIDKYLKKIEGIPANALVLQAYSEICVENKSGQN